MTGSFAPSITEFGDHVYIVAPVTIIEEPTNEQMETFAFQRELSASPGFDELKKKVPNPHILWLRGSYVEADNANSNGDMWTAGDLALTQLTPNFMPITVMHDFTSSVGLIADTKLLTPNADGVPRPRIETTLAVWAHRYPQVAAEIQINARQGTLMQSMECLSPNYECGECGMIFQRQPDWAEKDQWCAHLRGENGERAPRKLLSTTFTGSGLIFGTRGARGAYKDAHLEVEELAALHQELHAASSTPRRIVTKIEVEQSDYEATVAKAAEVPNLKAKVTELTANAEASQTKVTQLETEAAKVPELQTKAEKADELQTKVEELEAAKVKAEEERDTEKARADTAEEKQNQVKLRDERFEALGDGFKARLDKAPTTKTRLQEQAAEMSDEDWTARLAELKETLNVDPQAAADPTDLAREGLFTQEQVAQAGLVSATPEATANGASEVARRKSAIGGLAREFGKKSRA